MRSSGTRVPSRAHPRSNARCYNSVSGKKIESLSARAERVFRVEHTLLATLVATTDNLKSKRSSGTRVPRRAHSRSNTRCYHS
ncbi:hypothetical protein NDU88_003939 [Pleurodeles waltl]|uniref:Uncharacterized protein n=1 Tax=Pleurodeles waltl TaxID=8319 RepID=A0AAV7NUA2_PLEWA|nr:hypothetical protein NDU88_007676 [Pleurodeles waltl]KAJ1194651.1 hypothetical protein NDU88_003939 [Pleurodeles waltl]